MEENTIKYTLLINLDEILVHFVINGESNMPSYHTVMPSTL